LKRERTKSQENGDTAEYNGVQQRRKNWNWEFRSRRQSRRMRSESVVGRIWPREVVVEEELEVGL
jgi:hypothetical protein